MKIFLSWSGHPSHEVAVALRDWLPVVLPYVEPWMSSEDIDKGARWANEIANRLDEANFAIVCIVPGNVSMPWLNFEAGAISKTFDVAKVAPLLVGIDRDEVDGPLSQFQSTIFKKADVLKLVFSINRSHHRPIPSDRLRKNFNVAWGSLRAKVNKVDVSEELEVLDEEEFELEEEEEAILLFLAECEDVAVAASEIANAIKESLTKTKYFLGTLADDGYVHAEAWEGEEVMYELNDDGREYLLDNELIE